MWASCQCMSRPLQWMWLKLEYGQCSMHTNNNHNDAPRSARPDKLAKQRFCRSSSLGHYKGRCVFAVLSEWAGYHESLVMMEGSPLEQDGSRFTSSGRWTARELPWRDSRQCAYTKEEAPLRACMYLNFIFFSAATLHLTLT